MLVNNVQAGGRIQRAGGLTQQAGKLNQQAEGLTQQAGGLSQRSEELTYGAGELTQPPISSSSLPAASSPPATPCLKCCNTPNGDNARRAGSYGYEGPLL